VDVGKMVGIIAALGVGIGALGTLLGGFVSGFTSLHRVDQNPSTRT
jgi:hypothetical protein